MTTLSLSGVDVGSPRLSGGTKHTATRIEVIAGGEDIWGTRDEFHFAQAQVTGNFEVSVCVESLGMADVYTKAGLMLRASLDAGAPHVMMLVFGDNQSRTKNNGGLEFQSRLTAGGLSTGIYPPQPLPLVPDFPVNFPHVWLKVVRRGDIITSQSSQDGTHWRTFSVHQQSLPPVAYLGLAVTSHHATQTVKAIFSQLNFSQEQ